ncbi:protein BCCIP homolog [Nicotiana tabacum]|uniref:Protein BCCIP homolog n=1 Tax=Nicotiana tabacum TaxID=4097 RepID=A0A1S3ZSF0_TOBAC|nr:PREDICTED: protein BCCIP homolog [Nicotiana tabacum]XP_016467292.1 PREDICTED: protein BCCIP homolog [Nicotiana tabacum]XP_016467293.1 PREDICTED: protein BCCIP homolog [Nicotiana tabacum]XP_016467294.1 PREDICTED: protein BCCIP homolog [Nicotiana tabacum]
MPRKPARHCRSARCLPLSFSPFARSVAQIASNNKVTHKVPNSRFPESNLPSSSGKRMEKRRLVDKSENSGSSDYEESDGTVQADFEFFDPKPSDFHGVKILLQTYLDNKQWDLSGFVDVILGQPTVGTVVKIENDEDDGIYSIVTALNLGRYKDLECIADLKKFLLNACHQKDVYSKLSLFLGDQAKDVGLLVSQRVVNLPPQLLPHLYDALFDEVSWAREDEPTEELRNSFCFKFYLVISKIYKHKNAVKQNGPSGDQTVVYIKAEDEIFLELSSWSLSFPLHTQLVRTDELKDYRLTGLVMAIDATKIPTFRQKLHSLIDEA